MLTRGITILWCFKWLVAAPSFRPSPCLGLLPQSPFRFFSSVGHNPVPHTPDRLKVKKTARSPQHTLAETILRSLRQVAARTRSKRARPEPSEKEAICEALRTLGFEKDIQEFLESSATLPFLRKIQLLMTEEATHSDVKILLRRMAFLAVSLDRLTVFHNLLKRFFLTGENASKVLAQNSGILLQPVELLERKLQCLEDFEVGKVTCLRVGASTHHVLTMEADCLERRLTFLHKIGLSTKSKDRLLRKFPQVLKLSVENNLQPTVDFFEREGMSKVAMLKMFCLHPEFFGMSIDKNMALKIDTLKQLGLSSQDCCKVIGALAQCSSQHILACYNALRSHFSTDSVCIIVRKQPDILVRSLGSIEKKLDYLVNVENRSLQEIVRFPACLGYSLENRIVPRFNILKEKDLARKYSLPSILSVKPEMFKKRFSIPESVEIIS